MSTELVGLEWGEEYCLDLSYSLYCCNKIVALGPPLLVLCLIWRQQARAHVKAGSGLKTRYALEGIKSGAGRGFAWSSV